jgi:hypothetical protein
MSSGHSSFKHGPLKPAFTQSPGFDSTNGVLAFSYNVAPQTTLLADYMRVTGEERFDYPSGPFNPLPDYASRRGEDPLYGSYQYNTHGLERHNIPTGSNQSHTSSRCVSPSRITRCLTDASVSIVQNWFPPAPQWLQTSNGPQSDVNALQEPFLCPSVVSQALSPSRSPSSSLSTRARTRDETATTLIGNVYREDESGIFFYQCCHRSCSHTSFRRIYDVGRHHNSKHKHATAGPHFWCTVDGCDRSAVMGGRSFPRKDKLNDHVRKMHRGFVGI